MVSELKTATSLIDRLPAVRGRLQTNADMSAITWFRVGGPAEIMFVPKDIDDLCAFLTDLPQDVPVTVMGVGSNLLVRDGGIEGVVIRLGAGFNYVHIEADHYVRVGAATLDVNVAKKALKASIAGLEFLRGIPGAMGGALRMNAGAYEKEIKDVFVEALAVTRGGEKLVLKHEDMGFSYRHTSAPDELIFTEAVLQGEAGNPDHIAERMSGITEARELTQPIRSRTGGSTFKNPDPEQSGGRKAWQLIDEAGCRGRSVGDAQVSEQHCNFLINRGSATAKELEKLGEIVRSEVEKKTGIILEWEIRRIGRPRKGGGISHE